jgi:probable rRNA maturation factor
MAAPDNTRFADGYEIEIVDQQSKLAVDQERLRRAVEIVLQSADVRHAEVNVAVVDDPAIHELNRRWLDHDWPTDVLSFTLDSNPDRLEGEIVASADTAEQSAGRFAWNPGDELLLYVIHGALHLVGYDDQTDEARLEMRSREKEVLAQFGLAARYDETEGDSPR